MQQAQASGSLKNVNAIVIGTTLDKDGVIPTKLDDYTFLKKFIKDSKVPIFASQDKSKSFGHFVGPPHMPHPIPTFAPTMIMKKGESFEMIIRGIASEQSINKHFDDHQTRSEKSKELSAVGFYESKSAISTKCDLTQAKLLMV